MNSHRLLRSIIRSRQKSNLGSFSIITGHGSNCWKASTKDGSLKLYLTLDDPAAVLKLKTALNKTDMLQAQERTEKGVS